MQITYTPPKKNTLKCSIKVVFSVDDFNGKLKKRLLDAGKQVKMPGFRPGKIPLSVIESQYGDSLRKEIALEEMNQAYQIALEKENIVPAGPGVFEEIDYDDPEKTSFVAALEILPEIKLVALKKIKIERLVASVRSEDVEKRLEQYRLAAREWEEKPKTSKSEQGDQLVIDFVGKLDNGESFVGNEAKDFPLVLGEGSSLADFETALYDVQVGDSKRFSLVFPDQLGDPNLRAKKVWFEVEVKQLNQAILPEINSEKFLKKYVPDGDIESLKKSIDGDLGQQLQRVLDSHNHELISDALLKAHEFLIPEVMLEEEKRALMKTDEHKKLDDINQTALKRCRLGFLFSKFMEQMELKVDEAEVQRRLNQIARHYTEASEIEKLKQNKQLIGRLSAESLQEKLLEKMYEVAKVTKSEKTFDDLESLKNT